MITSRTPDRIEKAYLFLSMVLALAALVFLLAAASGRALWPFEGPDAGTTSVLASLLVQVNLLLSIVAFRGRHVMVGRFSRLGGAGRVIRDAILLSMMAGLTGALVNLVHPEHIPFVAEQEYEILVPCPEPGGDARPLLATEPVLLAPETFLVDARPADAHARWHVREAMNVPYDYLDPTPEATIQELARRIARSKAQRVVVYGDGDEPDTGEQLGREISSKGIKNVFFVRGGAPALRGQETPGGGP